MKKTEMTFLQSFEHRNVAGISFDNVTLNDVVELICSSVLDKRPGGFVVTPNLDILRLCHRSAEVMRLASSADLILADGMPVIWASRLLGRPLKERVAGSDLTQRLLSDKRLSDSRILLIGGNPGVAEKLARALNTDSGYTRVDYFFPPMGFTHESPLMGEIAEKVSKFKPDIVFVGLGFPKQERVIDALRAHAQSAWWLGVGYSLSFMVNERKRAPLVMQKLGLEWLHRMVSEPRRMVGRYLVHDLPFFFWLMARCAVDRAQVAFGRVEEKST